MVSPFDEVDGELRLIQYRPHQNCHLVARFVGGPDIECCDDEGGATTFDVPYEEGPNPGIFKVASPGDWIATRDGKTFEVVTADELIDFIKGTARTHLIA